MIHHTSNVETFETLVFPDSANGRLQLFQSASMSQYTCVRHHSDIQYTVQDEFFNKPCVQGIFPKGT